jgi:hypothetical protein
VFHDEDAGKLILGDGGEKFGKTYCAKLGKSILQIVSSEEADLPVFREEKYR